MREVSMLLLLACNQRSDLKISETVTEAFEQVPTNQVDILWVVDDSVSMAEEQERVTEGAQGFVASLDEAEVDFHLGVVTTLADGVDAEGRSPGTLLGEPAYLTAEDEDYADAFAARVAVGAVTDGEMESGIEASLLALSEPLLSGVNAGFLREDARLSVIVLSDEDDCSDFGALGEDADTFDCSVDGAPLSPVDELVEQLWDVKGADGFTALVQFSGIVGPEVSSSCPAAVPGDRYREAIALTGGLDANICSTDYDAILQELGINAAALQTTFNLSEVALEETLTVTVTDADGVSWDVSADGSTGWTYTSGTGVSRLTFHGAGVPPRGSTFVVTYLPDPAA